LNNQTNRDCESYTKGTAVTQIAKKLFESTSSFVGRFAVSLLVGLYSSFSSS
jgi:hypothetical protein